MIKVVVPNLGENIEKATVSYWFAKIGDVVTAQTDLIEVTTDKAAVNVPAPVSGVLKEISAREGDSVKLGDVLGVIDETATGS
jgi:2-oxoglutarate dehydrogenase E2 component (dihydrolipoamide succinyltransferase)